MKAEPPWLNSQIEPYDWSDEKDAWVHRQTGAIVRMPPGTQPSRDVTFWNPLRSAIEARMAMQAQALASQNLLYGYRPLEHTPKLAPFTPLGGQISRDLFQDLLSDPVDRGGVPNTLWLVTSLGLIVAGILVML